MKNVTITLPNELAHKAKVFAAQHNTSVSRYVGSLLAQRMEAEEGYERAMQAWSSRKPAVLNESRAAYPGRGTLYER